MRSIVVICSYLLGTIVGLGQGTVFFGNNVFGWVDAPFFDEKGSPLAGSNYLAQLYYWKPGEGFRSAGNPVPFGTNGYFFGGTVSLAGVGGGAQAWVQVRAWQANGGTNFEQAATAGAWSGTSEMLYISRTGDPFMVPPSPAAYLVGLQYPGRPIIIRQPQDQTVHAGEQATLSVLASSGVQMQYQWHQYPSERLDGLISGATNANYTTGPLTTNTTFWISLSNSAGSVFSDPATVTVLPPPSLKLEKVEVTQYYRRATILVEGVVARSGFYRLEISTNLTSDTWTRFYTFYTPPSSLSFKVVDQMLVSESPARFYRLRLVQ